MITNALSFDIEDWFHIVEVPSVADRNSWPKLPSLVEAQTEWILELLDSMKVRATFFILGWAADHHPHVVKLIAKAGHEIGSHSYWHRRVDRLTIKEFREDLSRSVRVLEELTGRRVLGFRAPSFSITPGAEWAFDVMHDLGLRYDASLFPARRAHGGYPCRLGPHQFAGAPSGRPMAELPMSVLRIGPLGLPFSGGGYLRLIPSCAIRIGFRHYHRQGLPVVVYLHPRDLAPDCPRVAMGPYRRFKCYVGLKTSRHKLRMLLKEYRFDTCAALLGIEETDSSDRLIRVRATHA
jgi:polysaccharide deacetylase family protein (PEP-CTERM system associated)